MNRRPLVVTGTGVLCAVGCGIDSVWTALCRLQSGLGSLSVCESARHGDAPVAQIPEEIERLCAAAVRGSRSDKLAYLAVEQASAQATLDDPSLDRARLGLVMGNTVGGVLGTEGFLSALVHRGVRRYGMMRHHECASSADICANEFDLRGPTTTLSTACSGGAMAIAMAADLIQRGDADIMIAGGCDSLCRLTVNGFGSLLLLDPDGCRPFDENRSGISLGEGAAAITIETEEGALARGATILARLSGWGTSCDAFHATAPDTEGSGAFRAMEQAVEMAGIAPAAVDHINTHGTATPGNDIAEMKAICRLFGEQPPPFLSTKGLFGHTLGASGTVDAVISIASLQHGGPPPSARFETVDPAIGLSPVLACGTSPQHHIMSNAFGFGGNNVSLVLSRPDAGESSASHGKPIDVKSRMRLGIMSMGVVTPLGSVLEDVLNGVTQAGASPSLREIMPPLPAATVPVYACPGDFGAKEEIKAGRRRRLERIQQMTLVAAKRAAAPLAAVPVSPERVCVAVGTGLGASITTAAFVEPIVTDPDAVPSPQKFTNAVHNALASQVGIELTARGLNSTTTHRDTSFEAALWHGANELVAGRADRLYAGGADELTPYLLSAGSRWGWWNADTPPIRPFSNSYTKRERPPTGEGAVVFGLAPITSSTDVPPLAELRCTAFGRFTPGENQWVDPATEAEWICAQLDREGISLDQIDIVISGANGWAPAEESFGAVVAALSARCGGKLRHGAYKHLCGDYHTASAFGLAMAVAFVTGTISAGDLLAPEGDNQTALLYTLSPQGTRAITCVTQPGALS